MEKASLTEKFAMIGEHWRPKVVAQLNGQELKLVKFQGAFPWHHHEKEDEMFLVWRGEMAIEFRDRRVEGAPDQFEFSNLHFAISNSHFLLPPGFLSSCLRNRFALSAFFRRHWYFSVYWT